VKPLPLYLLRYLQTGWLLATPDWPFQVGNRDLGDPASLIGNLVGENLSHCVRKENERAIKSLLYDPALPCHIEVLVVPRSGAIRLIFHNLFSTNDLHLTGSSVLQKKSHRNPLNVIKPRAFPEFTSTIFAPGCSSTDLWRRRQETELKIDVE
jgi:hypothetical protein